MSNRQEYNYNPIDFETDVAIGLTLPLTNDASAYNKYSVANGVTGSFADEPRNSSGKSDTQGDFHLSYTTLEQTKSNLRNLVLTNRGERIMHPEFGCDVWKSLFEHNTIQLREGLKDRIEKQIGIWLPYVNVGEVSVEVGEGNENRLNIGITFALFNNTIDMETIAIVIGDL